jgi:phospholipase C
MGKIVMVNELVLFMKFQRQSRVYCKHRVVIEKGEERKGFDKLFGYWQGGRGR